jgi:probable F420-dependent oxidoreductase
LPHLEVDAVRFGALIPTTDLAPADVRRFGEGVAELGFSHVTVYDHVLGADPALHPEFPGPWPFTTADALHEPFVLYGYLAAAAPGLELVTAIVISPQRQTALLAKQAAQVDLFTNGRFRLGIGQGWNPVEYDALGQDFRTRGRRLEEQVALMRRLWTEPVVTFEGTFDRVTAAGLNPLPVQRPIPVWIGGSSEAALRRAARIGDGFFPQNPLDGGWEPTLERMREWRAEAGRDPGDLGIEARVNVGVGSPEEWRAAAEEWRRLGATHISLGTFRSGLEGVDAHLERLAEAKEAVTG